MPGFPSSPVPSSPASACQLWLLLLLAWPLRRCFWERRALSPKPWSCSGVWGSPGRQPGCWEWGTAPQIPKSPQPQGLCWRWPWPEASPTAPSTPQTAARARNLGFHPFPVPFSWGCVVIHPPGTPRHDCAARSPPAPRHPQVPGRAPGQGACRSEPATGRISPPFPESTLPPAPVCWDRARTTPMPPWDPRWHRSWQNPCTGEPQGVPGAVVLSRGWWGSEDALSPVPSPGGAVPVPTAHKGKVESPSTAPGAGRELGELGRKRRAQAAGGFPSTSPSISPSSNYTSLWLNPENKTSPLGYSDGTPAKRKK